MTSNREKYIPFDAKPNPKSNLPQQAQDTLARQREWRKRQVRKKLILKLTAIIMVAIAIVVWVAQL